MNNEVNGTGPDGCGIRILGETRNLTFVNNRIGSSPAPNLRSVMSSQGIEMNSPDFEKFNAIVESPEYPITNFDLEKAVGADVGGVARCDC